MSTDADSARPLDLKLGGVWWCNSHQREATHTEQGKRKCDPKLGGITLPCFAVFIDGVEIVESILN